MATLFAAIDEDAMSDEGPIEQLYVAIYRLNDNPPPTRLSDATITEQHGASLQALFERKVILGSGPVKDEHGKRHGGAIVIMRAGSLAEAREIAAQEPICREGKRTFEVLPWQRKLSGD
jgi:uncharacterized protein YciI